MREARRGLSKRAFDVVQFQPSLLDTLPQDLIQARGRRLVVGRTRGKLQMAWQQGWVCISQLAYLG